MANHNNNHGQTLITTFIADDHAVVRDGLHLLLESQPDIRVVGHAANGRQAVKEVAKLCPHVLIVDIAMPGLDGVEVTRQIRKACPGTHVIILSMYATTEHIYQALQAGACGYVLKESAGGEVINAVRTVNAGLRYLSKKIDEIMVENYISQRLASGLKSPLETISRREREVLQLVVEGKSSAEISVALSLSPKTVETYRSRLMRKLGINDIPGLVKFAIQHGITRPE
ncbi:MAG: response regulator transcription factor [Nitrospirota bacterium]